jgi:6,7-dimethyl-8-ribityllumazine synthase
MKKKSAAKKTPAAKKRSQKIYKVAVVTSRFNEAVTLKLQEAALDYLEEMGVDILAVNVPGAIEIPITIQALFDAHKIDGAVALGAVIRGDTTHYDEVCRSVERACTTLMLDYKKPIGFGILTTENEAQAFDRAGGEHGNKGLDAAQTVVEMIGLLAEIRKNK